MANSFTGEPLKDAFTAFAAHGALERIPGLGGKSFFKIFQDIGLLGTKVTATDLDISYNKFKTPHARTMTFEQFCTCLEDLAQRKGLQLAELQAKIVAVAPMPRVAHADAKVSHTEQSLYALYTGGLRNGAAALQTRASATQVKLF